MIQVNGRAPETAPTPAADGVAQQAAPVVAPQATPLGTEGAAVAQAQVSKTTDSPHHPDLSKAVRPEGKGLAVEPALAAKIAIAAETGTEMSSEFGSKNEDDGETEAADAVAEPTANPHGSLEGAFNNPRAERTVTPLQQSTPVDNRVKDQLLRQVADRIEVLAAARSKESVTVHLDPGDLGEIKLVILQTDGRVEAQVYAKDDRVRQALQAAHAQLDQSLGQRGIKLNQFNVTTLNSGFSDLTGGNQQPASQQAAPQGHRFSVEASKPARAVTVSAAAGRGVDLTI
jgi:flagellar hook-length control protein FliK